MNRTILKTIISLTLVVPAAQAEDVYNFYFEKQKNKKVEQVVTEETVEEEVEIIEVPEDVLLMPDHWQPAQVRKKKYYMKRTAPEPAPVAAAKPTPEPTPEPKSTTNTAQVEEPKEEGRGRRGWSMNIGVGTVKLGYGNFFNSKIVQDVYAVGARYHMSRYFDVNAEILAPNGDYEISGFNMGSSLDPQFNIGLGVTPIHLNIFGAELLEIGADGGVSIGNDEYLLGEKNTVYIGPRVGVNIGDHFSINYVAKFDTQNDIKYVINTFSAGYRW